MGVDIYGKEPKLTSKKPEMDWDNDALTEADKKAYWEVLEDWEDKTLAITLEVTGGDGDQL